MSETTWQTTGDMLADAGTQAEPEARGSDRVVTALEAGRHWR